jgi:antitoxin MazE
MAEVEVIVEVKRWGNCLVVPLPAAVARAAHLGVDQPVKVAVFEGRVVITPVVEVTPLSLEQRLARYNPANHGGEAMVTEPVGAERGWRKAGIYRQ